MTVQTFKTAGPTASQLPLLSCRCIRGRSASQSPTANNPLPSAVTTTVVEYSPDAYVIQGQPKVRVSKNDFVARLTIGSTPYN